MTKPDKPLCGRNPDAPLPIGSLAFFVLLCERIKGNPSFTPADLKAELAGVSNQFEEARKSKKEKT